MGMNRKWNMRVFELHDSEGTSGNVPVPPQNDDVFVDTSGASITMKKYPFTTDGMIPAGTDPSSILEIDLANYTKDSTFLSYITDKDNWRFKEGNGDKIRVLTDSDTQIRFGSVVSARLDLPTESTRWVLKFDLRTHSTGYRSFFFFDGVEDENNMAVRYGYGMDVPRTGYPHLEQINVEDGSVQVVDQTIADEQYFTGESYMPVVVTRWDNTYTLYYDNRYMITVPVENDSLNRIGFWTWSGSETYVQNPELYVINNDSDANNIVINTETSDDNESQGGQNNDGSGGSPDINVDPGSVDDEVPAP